MYPAEGEGNNSVMSYGCLNHESLPYPYGSHVAGAIRYTAWSESKAAAIDLTSDFYWVEDELPVDEQRHLLARGVADRYIEVDHRGRFGLEQAWDALAMILEQRRSQYE